MRPAIGGPAAPVEFGGIALHPAGYGAMMIHRTRCAKLTSSKPNRMTCLSKWPQRAYATYSGRVTQEQLQWIRNNRAQVPKHPLIVVHLPIPIHSFLVQNEGNYDQRKRGEAAEQKLNP
jgi:hypothetical protein